MNFKRNSSIHINYNAKSINDIQKKIALIESKGDEHAFFLPQPTQPELQVYFDDLVTELEALKLPKDYPIGFHWMADQKRFHLIKELKDSKIKLPDTESIPNI